MADGCVFQTKDAKEWFPKKLQKKSTIIYNAVKADFFEIQRKPIDGLVVTCGRLEEQKNHKMLIRAFKNVVEKYPNTKLHIYGEGSLQEQLQKLIDDLGLKNSIILKGITSDVSSILKEADIFVLPSLYEGMPNALMEAMAVGVPSIATDCPCGGSKMLLEDENGVLVKNDDEYELSKAIELLLIDKSKKIQLSKNAKKEANNFKADDIYIKWNEYIEKVVYYGK